MSSIATTVFKLTIGLLVNKGRDKAAEKLKDGDITDQIFRGLIVREIDDIKSKLDGLSRKDLIASISFFEEGIELLYELFDKGHTARSTSEPGVTEQAACVEAFSLANEIRKLELSGLGESAKRVLSDAKERFKDARRRATDAFANEALKNGRPHSSNAISSHGDNTRETRQSRGTHWHHVESVLKIFTVCQLFKRIFTSS